MLGLGTDLMEALPLEEEERRQLASTSQAVSARLPSVEAQRRHTAALRQCYGALGFSLVDCLDEAARAFTITQTDALGQCAPVANNQMRRFIRLRDGLKAENQCKFLLATNRKVRRVELVLDRELRDDAHDRLFMQCVRAIPRVNTCQWSNPMEDGFSTAMRMCAELRNVRQHQLPHREGTGVPRILACDENAAMDGWRQRLVERQGHAQIVLVSPDEQPPRSPFGPAVAPTFLSNVDEIDAETCVAWWTAIHLHLDGQEERHTGDGDDRNGANVLVVAKDGQVATALACILHRLTSMDAFFATPITDATILQRCETMWEEVIPLHLDDA